jgi:hypothetical protein
LEIQGKVSERGRSTRMTRRTECKCSSMEVNDLRQVRQDTPLLKSGLETCGKVIERCGLIRMTMGTECKCSLMVFNGLI